MKSKIFTYRRKKKIWIELSSFVEVKSKKQFENLIDVLLDIDAVSSPGEDLKFPCVVQIENNTFGPTLIQAEEKEIKNIKKIKEIKDKLEAQNITPVYEE